MTIAEEIIHELKRLRTKANKDVREAKDILADSMLRQFRNGLNMSIRVATQINNRRGKK